MNTDIIKLIKAIRSGGKQRDKALKQLFQDPQLQTTVKKVVEEGGGDMHDSSNIFEKCIIIFDRVVRLEPTNTEIQNVNEYFLVTAKKNWSHVLQSNTKKREKVLAYIAADSSLPDKLAAGMYKKIGSTNTIPDAYQQGFVKVAELLKKGQYRGGNIKAYFFTVCKHLVEYPSSSEPPSDNVVVKEQNPLDQLISKEAVERITEAFNKLGDRCKKIIALRRFRIEPLNLTEIAEEMGLKNAQNAANLLNKCNKKLKLIIGSFNH